MARKDDVTSPARASAMKERERIRKETPLSSEERVTRRDALLAEIENLDIVEAVKAMRHALGKTQTEYARMAGITRRTLSLIETGQFNPSLQVLENIGRPFGFEVGFRVPASRRRTPSSG